MHTVCMHTEGAKDKAANIAGCIEGHIEAGYRTTLSQHTRKLLKDFFHGAAEHLPPHRYLSAREENPP